MSEIYSPLTTFINPNAMNYGRRNGMKIDKIIIHHNATTNKDVAMNTWLVSGSAGTSAHYEITPTEIIGCVGEEWAAFHAGGTGGSDIPKISNPNQRSIGLEHVNSTGAPSWLVDDRTLDNSARLIADICKRYKLIPNNSTILAHGTVTATACPGGLNMNKLIEKARSYYNGNNEQKPNKPKIKEKKMLYKVIDGKNKGNIYFFNGEFLYHVSPIVASKLSQNYLSSDMNEAEFNEFLKYFKVVTKK